MRRILRPLSLGPSGILVARCREGPFRIPSRAVRIYHRIVWHHLDALFRAFHQARVYAPQSRICRQLDGSAALVRSTSLEEYSVRAVSPHLCRKRSNECHVAIGRRIARRNQFSDFAESSVYAVRRLNHDGLFLGSGRTPRFVSAQSRLQTTCDPSVGGWRISTCVIRRSTRGHVSENRVRADGNDPRCGDCSFHESISCAPMNRCLTFAVSEKRSTPDRRDGRRLIRSDQRICRTPVMGCSRIIPTSNDRRSSEPSNCDALFLGFRPRRSRNRETSWVRPSSGHVVTRDVGQPDSPQTSGHKKIERRGIKCEKR